VQKIFRLASDVHYLPNLKEDDDVLTEARRVGGAGPIARSFRAASQRGELSMSKFMTGVQKFVKGEEGATMVEYGLLLAFIAVVCIVAVAAIGSSAKTLFNTVAGTL
jgi:pilus assembly protein Flp/PilA